MFPSNTSWGLSGPLHTHTQHASGDCFLLPLGLWPHSHIILLIMQRNPTLPASDCGLHVRSFISQLSLPFFLMGGGCYCLGGLYNKYSLTLWRLEVQDRLPEWSWWGVEGWGRVGWFWWKLSSRFADRHLPAAPSHGMSRQGLALSSSYKTTILLA